MKTFKKWNGKPIEDWGCYCSKDYKSFCAAFRNYLKRTFPEAEVIGFKANHYDTSGFLRFDEEYIYISESMDRSKCYVDFNETGAMNGILYRTAKGPKDYRGGMNNFSSIYELEGNIRTLLARERWIKAAQDVKTA